MDGVLTDFVVMEVVVDCDFVVLEAVVTTLFVVKGTPVDVVNGFVVA